MIKSFKCRDTKKLYEGKRVVRFDEFRSLAERRLDLLDNATSLIDLDNMPSNCLTLLHGTRLGKHSIHINDHYQLCFFWSDNGPEELEIIDTKES